MFDLQHKLENIEISHNNETIQNEIESGNLGTKVKLVSIFLIIFTNCLCGFQLEDALTRRNVDVEQAEDNNRQLLNLLEKYDNKLDELQEDNELKDMKIFEYERLHLGDRPKIRIESIEDKVKFLIQVLKRLREMYLHDANERVEYAKSLSSPGSK